MKELTVSAGESGQRLSKYLSRIMPNAGSSFLYKMLRKKNITLNDAKATGNESVKTGDIVKVFFSEETFAKMQGEVLETAPASHPIKAAQLVYEDEDLLAVYKPSGVLSQKDASGTESLNEQVLAFLSERGDVTPESLRTFRPGVCNRLDRNTAGVVWFGKTLRGAQGMAMALRERILGKYYFAFVEGHFPKAVRTKFYLCKDTTENRVTISDTPQGDFDEVRTDIWPVVNNSRITLVRIRLHSGKSHQIRSVLKHLGFPVLGDPKYGSADSETVRYCRSRYHLHAQQLFAYAYTFPEKVPAGLSGVAGRTIRGPVPDTFAEILAGEFPPAERKEGEHGYLEIPRP